MLIVTLQISNAIPVIFLLKMRQCLPKKESQMKTQQHLSYIQYAEPCQS